MEENKSFKKKTFTKKPYRVDAKALESKGFELIRYDRHESYAKTYCLDGRVFTGTVNPVTGDRSIIKAGPFASTKDMEDLRAAWDLLTADILGPRPDASVQKDPQVLGNASLALDGSNLASDDDGKISAHLDLGSIKTMCPEIHPVDNQKIEINLNSQNAMKAPAPSASSFSGASGGSYVYHDLTGDEEAIVCPKCGHSHFSVDYCRNIDLAMPTIVRDGHLVPQQPLTKTRWHCTCLDCGSTFETARDPLGQTPVDAGKNSASGAVETAKKGE